MKFRIPTYIIVIAILLLITDLQYIYNIDYLWSRSIGILMLLTFFPGFLLYKLLHDFKEVTTKVICYAVGLSISLVMFIVLIMNYVFITYTSWIPLVRETLLITLNSIIIPLLLINTFIIKGKTVVLKMNLFKGFKFYDYILIFVATLFPLFSLIGTALLNNGGSNMILLINLAAVAVYIFLIGVIWKYIHNTVFPYSIFMIGLSILFNISLRSWLVSGSDILTEYRMFQSTLTHGYWSNILEKHSYNACISITLLPTIYAKLLDMNNDYIFKFVFQILFAFVPVVVYVFTMKFTNRIVSFLSSILFLSFPIFVNSMSMHIRQEVAFLFFSLMLLSIFEEKLHIIPKFIIMILFGFGMIISHYSTTFIGLGLLTIWYCLDLLSIIYLKWIHTWITKRIVVHEYKRILSIFFILLMYAFSFFWYTKVVNIGAGLQNLEKKIVANLPNLFSNDVRVDQTSLANQFNIFYQQKNKTDLLRLYVNETNAIAAKNYSGLYYPPKTYKDYRPEIIEEKPVPLHISGFMFKYAVIYMELIKKIQKVLSIVGVLILTYMFFREEIDKDFLTVSVSSLILLLTFLIVPFFTIEYDILRTTQQLMIILAVTSLIGGLFLLYFFGNKIKYVLISIFIVSYFVVNSNLYIELIGGYSPSIQFDNEGIAVERFFVYDSERKSIEWLAKNKRSIYLVQSDGDSMTRITMNTLTPINSNEGMLPSTIYRSSYVYLNKFNVEKGVTYKNFQGELLRYTIPQNFLDKNKDLLYNNRSSKVYQ